jgi:predicted dehydrogenase
MGHIRPGLRGHFTPEAMLAAERLDVVHICTPPASHAPLARMALEAGCSIYVEKPFTEQAKDAEALLALAAARGLKVCAGHQLLQEAPTLVIEKYLASIGRIAHVESYFSFRPTRHAPGGRTLLRADKQLLDILPHPVYLLLRMLERAGGGPVEMSALELSDAGTVHALVRSGGVTGTLVVTLEGRPVESHLRVIGSNGSLFGDYVRGTVLRSIGPGSSGIDKLFAPYRQGWQVLTRSTAAFARRFLKRQRSYPGLAELFDAFYQSVRSGGAPRPSRQKRPLESAVRRQSLTGLPAGDLLVRVCRRAGHAPELSRGIQGR